MLRLVQFFIRRKIILNPPIAAILILILWDWLRLDWDIANGLFNDISSDPFTTIASLLIIYFACFLAATGIEKLVTKTKFTADVELKRHIDELIRGADLDLFVVSPYLEMGNSLMEPLVKAAKDGVHVVLIHHSSQLKKHNVRTWLERLKTAGVEVHHHPNLHAKLYLNEDRVIIASLNLVNASFNDSFEAGVDSNSTSLIKEVRDYIECEILDSDLCQETVLNDVHQPTQGFCIRTKKPVMFDPSRPIHREEFYRVPDRDGKYCHACGSEAKTHVNQPFCPTCQGKGLLADNPFNSSSRS